jgi:sarcosine oxidase
VERADAIVVGGGVMGAAAAWRLARDGRLVALLEQFEVGHRRGSSHGAARVFRFSYDDPEYVRMAMDALPLWRELEAEAGQRILTVTGGFDLGSAERLESHMTALAACGATFDLLSGAAVTTRFPVLSIGPDDRVLHQRDAGVLAADRAVRAMVDLAGRSGATVHERTLVRELRRTEDGAQVVTDGGAFLAPVAVVTAGAWAARLLAGAGIDIPVTPSRESVAFFPVEDEASLPVFVEWTEGPLYALPGGGQGLKTGWHHTGPVTDPDEEGPVEQGVVDRMSAWVAERFPGAEPHPHHVETCLYTNTDDERFILERHGPIVVGSACSGHGFKFAPLIGQRLAKLATET